MGVVQFKVKLGRFRYETRECGIHKSIRRLREIQNMLSEVKLR